MPLLSHRDLHLKLLCEAMRPWYLQTYLQLPLIVGVSPFTQYLPVNIPAGRSADRFISELYVAEKQNRVS